MTDLLDLDALAPPDKKIKVRGKILTCKPLTIRQMINVVRLEERLKNTDDAEQIIPIIKEVLSPFMPDVAKDDTIDFTVMELRQIIKFAQEVSVPDVRQETVKEYDPKKKVVSPEGSHTSSTSTQATQSKTS